MSIGYWVIIVVYLIFASKTSDPTYRLLYIVLIVNYLLMHNVFGIGYGVSNTH